MIEINQTDKLIYDREIGPYLPERIFDAHTHLFQKRFHPGHIAAAGRPGGDVDMEGLRSWWQALFPDKHVNGLVMGFPMVGMDWQGESEFVAEQVRDDQDRFSLLTVPSQSGADLEAAVQRFKPFGLKPYLCFADVPDVQQAEITDFLPEEQIAVADKYGLALTIHVSKPRGMADAGNLASIKRLVAEYPKCKFILAHCGRCFVPVNMEDALAQLPVAENLWLDTSAVCDMGVFMHLLNGYDRSRICFGTDLVDAAAFRGQYVRMGMTWDCVSAEQMARPNGQKLRATYCAYENMRSLISATRFCLMGEDDRKRLFYGNAAELFGL